MRQRRDFAPERVGSARPRALSVGGPSGLGAARPWRLALRQHQADRFGIDTRRRRGQRRSREIPRKCGRGHRPAGRPDRRGFQVGAGDRPQHGAAGPGVAPLQQAGDLAVRIEPEGLRHIHEARPTMSAASAPTASANSGEIWLNFPSASVRQTKRTGRCAGDLSAAPVRLPAKPRRHASAAASGRSDGSAAAVGWHLVLAWRRHAGVPLFGDVGSLSTGCRVVRHVRVRLAGGRICLGRRIAEIPDVVRRRAAPGRFRLRAVSASQRGRLDSAPSATAGCGGRPATAVLLRSSWRGLFLSSAAPLVDHHQQVPLVGQPRQAGRQRPRCRRSCA